KEAIEKGLFFRKSFLICAPSGSGKTLIGELCAISNIFHKFGKSVYLVPFKALATEKYYDLKKKYSRFGVNIELSIGDYDIDDSKLSQADITVTTYEKMDSILRNFYTKEWIYDISTIIIDEIHVIGDDNRGPRLESLIVRLNEFLGNPQIIGLSATIANPEFFTSWLSSLGNKTTLIKSEKRPVPLHYHIEVTQNKDSTIKKYIKSTLKKEGQLLIFLNTRKSTQKLASTLKDLTLKTLISEEKKQCRKLRKILFEIRGGNYQLQTIIENGIAFHHAGLLPKERKIIEDNFRKRVIKVICCTTTLSAGINTPARMVILKEFKRFVTSGYNIQNFKGFYENGDGFSYFKPFSSNEVFQMLGRAGRPGLDTKGYGVILVSNVEERAWIEDHFFKGFAFDQNLIPKYEDLTSGLNSINILKEQVLLRIFEEKQITLEELFKFFKKTFFWYCISQEKEKAKIPIEELLMIKEISPQNILKLHSNPQIVQKIKIQQLQIQISSINRNLISGHIKTNYGVFECEFNTTKGVNCSCGFNNGISDNFATQDLVFEFCDHITTFLLYLLDHPNEKLQKYVNDIIPRSIKDHYILSYLLQKGLILNENGKLKCSQFGKLIIRLYLYPESGVMIRYILEHQTIENFQELVKVAYEITKTEGQIRNNKYFQPLLEWIDEEPIENILDLYKIMAGDLYSLRDSVERIITFIGIIASHLGSSGQDIKERMEKVAEMCETLRIRVKYGIKEELFDLVIRLHQVGRVRARILFNVGYHTSSQVLNENPYTLNRKTGLGVNLCKKILKESKE
ncbi:MAG: DEAD/DEAH box helicase, partial [Candidatus Lokiarchaeota archaeon]